MFSRSFLVLSKNHDFQEPDQESFVTLAFVFPGVENHMNISGEMITRDISYLLCGRSYMKNERNWLGKIRAFVNLGNIFGDFSNYFVVNQNFKLEAHNLRQIFV